MSRFAIKTPYFIMVVCLMIAVVGVMSVSLRMPSGYVPVDEHTRRGGGDLLFRDATGTNRVQTSPEAFERFFTLASGIEHIESRSFPE